MNHWAEKYLQVQYKDMNCSKFVEHILRDHFKIDFNFPQSEGYLFRQSEQIRESIPLFASRTETPKDGDLVLMHGKRRMCHVGMFVKIGIKDFVLHTEVRLKTAALHPLNALFQYGYTVEGYYTWLR